MKTLLINSLFSIVPLILPYINYGKEIKSDLIFQMPSVTAILPAMAIPSTDMTRCSEGASLYIKPNEGAPL